jgi:hypothetical protein
MPLDPNTLPGIARWRENPEAFFIEVLGIEQNWSKQVEIANSVRDHTETIVKSCHGVGKTRIAAEIANWFLHSHWPSKVITTAPSWPQVEKLLWSEIRALHGRARIPLGSKLDMTQMTIAPDHYAIGLSPAVELSEKDQGVRFQGFHSPHLLIIFDEAPGVREALWELTGGLMSSGHVRFLAIGNPVAPQGSFYEAFSKRKGNCITMELWDSPNFKGQVESLAALKALTVEQAEAIPLVIPALSTPGWARRMLDKWGEDSPLFQARVLSQFPQQGVDSLISLSWLEASAKATVSGGKKTLGVDVARFGTDRTVFYPIHGHVVQTPMVFQGQDTQATANRLIDLIKREEYELVVIDDDGVGGGVTDRLGEWLNLTGDSRCGIYAFKNGAEPHDRERFYNLRAEAYWTAREAIRNRTICVPEVGELWSELTSIKYRYVENGRLRIEGKDEMKKRGLPSPDEADAFMMACYVLEGSGVGTKVELHEGPDMEASKEWL